MNNSWSLHVKRETQNVASLQSYQENNVSLIRDIRSLKRWLFGEGTEALAQDLGALDDVHKRMGIDVIERRPQPDHALAVKGDIEHLALLALIEATA